MPSMLPSFRSSPSAVREKAALSTARSSSSSPSFLRRLLTFLLSQLTFLPLRIGLTTIPIPIFTMFAPPTSLRSSHSSVLKPVLKTLAAILVLVAIPYFSLVKHPTHPFTPSSTLVLTPVEAQRVWAWEIASGRFPSRREVPRLERVVGDGAIQNPAVPEGEWLGERGVRAGKQVVLPAGEGREYVEVGRGSEKTWYPKRPVKGLTLDMDKVMDDCDFSKGKYVRDCLELLKLSGGLSTGLRSPSSSPSLTFLPSSPSTPHSNPPKHPSISTLLTLPSTTFSSHLSAQNSATLSHPPNSSCERIYHMYWGGPFTDKPYVAALSFLYTQPVFLHLPISSTPPPCRPELWFWINPGPASSEVDDRAEEKMMEELRGNPWSAPLLNRRFEGVVRFKLWNTTRELDRVEELEGWREMSLFNSGGMKYDQKKKTVTPDLSSTTNTSRPLSGKAGLHSRVGSTSYKNYDRLSVVLSDMFRFVVTHRYGGIYLDADTLFLRDWEELWNWSGSFAYRWSRLEKYNTAVLKMAKGSAVGWSVFKSARGNGMDFHPMTVSRYMKDAGLEPLLLRLPDALFDPAWLNTEYYQRDRPPFPYLKKFDHFFQPQPDGSAEPSALGFDGFFKGAFSYHFHNFWWLPFDPSRNYPDLGPRFSSGEHSQRLNLLAQSLASARKIPVEKIDKSKLDWRDYRVVEERDLGWSAVLKRTFEGWVRGERPNLYGEFLSWEVEEEEE